ncbi:Aminomethyltransferase [Paenibacillus konkukensis]|uniref:Aminomethyltransferase n=1 Tax=Paenibacillus konkukensis TaxID=2020716 RepID=A0ABY4RJM7_9BACL|nr:glycine cleavage system aminomethyltransferase GcvT [Paenibacillus konkukensis]UQZ82235.1 Aminomethyltransferase [Paenibacillus konkukensis]
MAGLKRTPLFPQYRAFSEMRRIDFGGWELPVHYYGIQLEHEAVRQQAGLFDVSHMGEIYVTGQFAETMLQRLTTNDLARLYDGKAQYTLMCQEDGGVVDDLLVYRLSADQFMLVVNAANVQKDIDWLEEHLIGDVTLANRSDATALLSLQGPKAQRILQSVTDAPLDKLKPLHFIGETEVCGLPVLLSRTGYTGEDGFELYVGADSACGLWSRLLEAGEPAGLLPAGLGARDTLRFEAALPLYGQELSASISPLEAGLLPFVKWSKGDFIGRDALRRQFGEGIPRRLVGLEMRDRGIPRAHYPVCDGDVRIGEVTSGTQSPTLKRSLGLALVPAAYAEPGTELQVDIRGKRLRAEVVRTPFYRRA